MLKSILVRLFLLFSYPLRKRVKRLAHHIDSNGGAIVSNNCLAGIVYRSSGLPNRTPTVGLYFIGPAFKEFLTAISSGNLKDSQYGSMDEADIFFDEKYNCPVMAKNGVPKIVFLHYQTPAHAAAKWNERIDRLYGRKIFALASIRDGVRESDFAQKFDGVESILVIGSDKSLAPPADLCFVMPWTALKIRNELERCASPQ